MPTVADILETPENRSGGLLVVTMPHTVSESTASRRAFLSDRSVNRGPVLERFCEWFSLWGMPLQRTRGKESAFERAFALALWPAREPADAHGPQFVKAVAPQVPELLKILEARRPRLVIFLSAYLWQAVQRAEQEKGRPSAIILKTVKGKGVSFMENQVGWHGKAPNEEQYHAAMDELTAALREEEAE